MRGPSPSPQLAGRCPPADGSPDEAAELRGWATRAARRTFSAVLLATIVAAHDLEARRLGTPLACPRPSDLPTPPRHRRIPEAAPAPARPRHPLVTQRAQQRAHPHLVRR